MAISPYFTTSNQYILYDIHVDEVSQSIANNTTTIRVYVLAWRTNTGYTTDGNGTCYVTIDGVNYNNSWGYGDGHAITYNSDTVLFDQTVTIPHNADGKKTIYVSAYISHARFNSSSQGFNVALTDIPRQATLTSAPNFKDTDNPTISYNNPAGNAVTSLQACISLNGSNADVAYRDISKTGSSYTFNLTQAERNTLLASIPSANNRSVVFIVKSVIGGVTYYSSKSVTFSIVNANPTITGASYKDVNSTTTAITGNNRKIIQNKSSVRFTFSSLTAVKYATLANITVVCNGVTKSSTLSRSTATNYNVNLGVINSSSDVSASITLTDSRGNKASASLNITMLDWMLPTATITLRRKSNYYNESYLTVNASYSSLDNQNSVTIKYQYKLHSAGSYGSQVTINNGQTYTFNLSNENTYDFKITITDRLGTTTYNKTLQRGIPIIYFDRLKTCVGVGTIPEENNMFEADRRISLKNLNHETVADLWSTTSTEPLRSAFLKLSDKDGNERVRLTGYDGGQLSLYRNNKALAYLGFNTNNNAMLSLFNNNGNTRAQMYLNDNGGQVWTANANGNGVGTLGANSNLGGYVALYNYNSNLTAHLFTGSGNDGTLNLYNSSGSYTINLSGANGWVTCVKCNETSSKKVKENISELDLKEALKVLELEAVKFDFKNKSFGTDRRGFIAEDVVKVIPQVVTQENGDLPAGIHYTELIPYLQTVAKYQEQRINELQARIAELEKKLSTQDEKK